MLAPGTLRIADNVKIVESSNASTHAPLENTGSVSTEVGAGAKVGGLLSVADVWLRSNATVYGDLRSAGKIDPQQGAKVTGVTQPYATLGDLRSYRITVKMPAATASIALEPNQTAPVVAGTGYASIILKTGSYVALSAGQYYTELLQLEPDATLKLDTRNGPVILWVKNQLNYKGKVSITGPDGAFMIGYLGTNQTSLEKTISATVIAPNATLRLAPIGSPGWRGSFFAKSIDAEAGSMITHRAFDYWDQLMELKPILHCARRNGTTGAVLFGYENRSDFAAAIPVGPNNQLSPSGSVQPPTVLQPGVRNRQFWAPFDLATGMKWTLSGTEVAVVTSTPDCQLGDATPGDTQTPNGSRRPIDVPGPLPSHLQAIKLPDQHTGAMSGVATVPPASRYANPVLLQTTSSSSTAGDVAVAEQAQTDAGSDLVNYTFKITSYFYDGSEGACGDVDPYVKLWVNEQYFGDQWQATVQIPKDQEQVHVRAEIWDSDGGLCFKDDLLDVLDANLDTYTDLTDGGSNFFGIHWSATPTRQPKLCMLWNAQFLDSGPWASSNGTVGAEDFGATKGIQQIPASYAWAWVHLANDANTDPPLFSWTGVLDKEGCVPEDVMPPRAAWTLGTGLRVRTNLYSKHCLDSNGTECANDNGVVVRTWHPDPVIPDRVLLTALCQVFAEDPGSVVAPDCSVRAIPWAPLPPWPLNVNYATPQFSNVPLYIGVPQNSGTRAAAAVSHVLKREADTDGGLGVSLAMGVRRYGGIGPMDIYLETYCPSGLTSCQGTDGLFLEPAGVRTTDITQFKFVITHEFGHWVSGAGMGHLPTDYGAGPGIAGVSPLCQCGHVPTDQQPHCLQSLERPSGVQQEGFANLFAAKVWNKDLEANCTFAHAKDFLNDVCMPGVQNCHAEPGGSRIVNEYPIPFSCQTPVRWRNNKCLAPNSSPDLLSHGVEMDWLEFYYAINNNAVPEERWSVTDIFTAYIKTCLSNTTIPGTFYGCDDAVDYISWVGAPATTSALAHKSFIGGVNAAFGALSPKANAFVRDGDDYGVSNRL